MFQFVHPAPRFAGEFFYAPNPLPQSHSPEKKIKKRSFANLNGLVSPPNTPDPDTAEIIKNQSCETILSN